MSKVNFGDSPTAGAWASVGFNLDQKVTTATSTNVCQPAPGSPPNAKDDGQDGIDNSWGENLCGSVWDTLGASCSTDIVHAYVVTDASGSGVLTIQFSVWRPNLRIDIPIHDAYAVLHGDGSGTLGATTPIMGLFEGVAAAVARQNACSQAGGGPGQSFYLLLAQAADILSDGSNPAGQPCDAISIGMQFWDATPLDGGVPEAPDACPTD